MSSIHHIPDSVVLNSHKRQLQMISWSPFQQCKLLLTPQRLGFNSNISVSISANLSMGRQLLLSPGSLPGPLPQPQHPLGLTGALVLGSWGGEQRGCRSWDIHLCHANSWTGEWPLLVPLTGTTLQDSGPGPRSQHSSGQAAAILTSTAEAAISSCL